MATNVENTLNKLMVGPQHRFENGAVIQPAWPAKYAGPILPLQQVPEQFRAELDEMSAEYMRKLEQHPFRAKFGPGGGLRVIPSGERVPVQFDPKDLELIAAETHRPTLLQASKAPIASAMPSGASKVSGVPQVSQKPRSTWLDERNFFGAPRVQVSPPSGAVASGA